MLTDARLTRDDVSRSGLRTLVWQQFFDGIAIFDGVLKAGLTERGELVNIGSQFAVAPAAAAATGTPGPAQRIAARRAVALAAQGIGLEIGEGAVVEKNAAAGASLRQLFAAPGVNDATAELTWLPMNADALRLCWSVVLSHIERGETFCLLIDATTGEALVRHGLTEYLSDASYRVFTSDSPTPFSPGHSDPQALQPPLVARTLVTTAAIDPVASPNGWIDDGVNETRGNNVDAHTDLNRDNLPDTPRPQGSPERVFDFPLDLTLAPAAYRAAAVTNLFYWCNRIHDRFYEFGFTETAGNFQNDNFGRGGLGGDAMQADAQDGSGTNNANFTYRPDGMPGRIQMYVFTGPNPDRDGDFDAEVMIHEYTHGLSNRLIGGGSGLYNLQSRGIGEGWSDFYALCLLSEAGDDVDGNFAVGAYVARQLAANFETNYYFGIRRYPCTTALARNPLTFKDIDPQQASAHSGVALNPHYSASNSNPAEVHGQGEVWCAVLWEVRANLVRKLGFAAGQELVLQLVTDGMKLTPANPTFVQARDAILQAELLATGGAHSKELWAAFAKRGLGVHAAAPASSTTLGVVENFDVPDDLSITPVTSFISQADLGGPFTPAAQTYTLHNEGTEALVWSAEKTQPWLSLSATSGSLAPGASAVVVISINAEAAELPLGVATDVVIFHHPSSSTHLARPVQLTVDAPRTAFFPLDTDPGWARTGQWAFGQPTGQGASGGLPPGYPDPASGATGTKVFGVNLAGTYGLAAGPFFLTTTAIDCRGLRHISVRFQRWLNTPRDLEAEATLEVSANGTTWSPVWKNGAFAVTDSKWVKVRYDISAVADNQPTVFLRWGYRVNAGTIATYSGWNIDDIAILGTPNNLSITLPAIAREGAVPGLGVVTANPAPTEDLLVRLTAGDISRLSVPASVTIPAGATSAAFPVAAVENGQLDGSPVVTVTPSAPGWAGDAGTTLVEDSETAILTLSLPASGTEGGSVTGVLTVSAPPSRDVAVTLSSSLPASAQPVRNVTLRAGETSAVVTISLVDNAVLDGIRQVAITAHVAGWADGNATLTVIDNDVPSLSLSIGTSILEGKDAGLGTVRASGTVPTALVVPLASDDRTEIIVPASVTIPAGQSSATFPLTCVNDTETDGTQIAYVTASAPGFAPAFAPIAVLDDDVHHFSFGPITSPQIRGAPIFVQLTLRDVNDEVITEPSGLVRDTANLGAVSGANSLPIAPTKAVFPTFDGGMWTSIVVVNALGTQVMLTANDGRGHSSTSDPFDVIIGPLHHFAWEPIVSPRSVGEPIPALLRAVDLGGNLIESFSGVASLSGALLDLRPPVGTDTFKGGILFSWEHPVIRVQRICPASALGGAGRFGALAVEASVPSLALLKHWTIRLKHTTQDRFATANWDLDGWTTVHVSDAMVPGSGRITFPFQTAFDYDGTSNLMIDFSYRNATPLSLFASCQATSDIILRSLSGYSDDTEGDPLAWGNDATNSRAISSYAVNVRFTATQPIAMTPATAGPFVSGVWQGPVAITAPGQAVTIRADAGAGVAGESNALTIDLSDLDGDGLPDAWAASYGVHGAFEDPDADGLCNFLEHAMGFDPTTSQVLPRPQFTAIPDDDEVDYYLTWSYRRLLHPRALSYNVEISENLETWSTDGVQQIGLPIAGADGLTETVNVRVFLGSVEAGDELLLPPRFLRLRVLAP